MTDMTDDEFIGYCKIHNETERALFSGEQLNRLITLSGISVIPDFPVDQWFQLKDDVQFLLERIKNKNDMASNSKPE